MADSEAFDSGEGVTIRVRIVDNTGGRREDLFALVGLREPQSTLYFYIANVWGFKRHGGRRVMICREGLDLNDDDTSIRMCVSPPWGPNIEVVFTVENDDDD